MCFAFVASVTSSADIAAIISNSKIKFDFFIVSSSGIGCGKLHSVAGLSVISEQALVGYVIVPVKIQLGSLVVSVGSYFLNLVKKYLYVAEFEV